MNSYHVTLDEAADRRLHAIAALKGCTVENLIEISTEEAALDFFRHRTDDPGHARQTLGEPRS